MVSFLSFFTNKKKARGSSPPISPDSDVPRSTTATPTTTPTTRPPSAGRLLSLRHKPSPKPYDLSSRRASSELSRKKSQKRASFQGTSSTGIGELTLPKLDLGPDILSPTGSDASLAFGPVGGKVELTAQEKGILDKLRWDVGEVKVALEVFGKVLRDTGHDIVGIMLPHKLGQDPTTQRYLVALFALSIKPELSTSFPSISLSQSDSSQSLREKLQLAVREIDSPVDLAEVIKFVLRRLTTSGNSVIDNLLYAKFVQDEHALSYPLAAYETLLLSNLPSETRGYLTEIFELLAGLATYSDANTMSSGRLSYLLGWWISGREDISLGSWEKLYADWQGAGKRVEHLFYAWIRYQSTTQQLPTRLLSVVKDYPFGESSASSEHLPLPPPSSFNRRTLHISLTTDQPIKELSLSPAEILRAALAAKVSRSDSVPLWSSLRPKSDVSDILSEESVAFLNTIGAQSSRTPATTPKPEEYSTPPTANDGPLYRPFSSFSAPRTSPNGHSRQRSQSHGGLAVSPAAESKVSSNTSIGDKDRKQDDSPISLRKQVSLGVFDTPSDSVWDDFQKSGFGDSPTTVGDLGLAFSPRPASSGARPAIPKSATSPTGGLSRGSGFGTRPAIRKKTTFQDQVQEASVPGYSLDKEEVVEVNDVFLSFVEDGQLDPTTTIHWPPFTLARLVTPLSSVVNESCAQPDSAPRPIEWLLITIEHQEALPPPTLIEKNEPELDLLDRSMSPSATSNSSRTSTNKGFKDFANSFKRSSSFVARPTTGMRRSIFGGSARSMSKHAESALPPLVENPARNLQTPASAHSLTPTEYTVGEMGEIVKIPSQAQPSVDSSTPVKFTKPGVTGPVTDSVVSDWSYVAEGAAHVVFAYRGTSPTYIGKVLRIRKANDHPGSAPEMMSRIQEVQQVWRHDLLPRLVPSHLLVSATEVVLDQVWYKDLLAHADEMRPEARKVDGTTLAELVEGEGKGLLMEDTTVTERKGGTVTLAVEIKPKWGFLPAAEFLEPPDSVPIKSRISRFTLHSHYRGEDVSGGEDYDPVDLYSSEEERMARGLEGLWQIWSKSGGKANNLRVFVDGLLVTPDQAEKIPNFSSQGGLAEGTMPFILPLLKSSNILSHLKALQHNLDPTDISDLVSRFRSVYPAADLFDPALVPDPSMSELNELVNAYLADPSAGSSPNSSWTLRQRLVAYSLSAIFKDCSIFVKATLKRSDDELWVLDQGQTEGGVKMIDLDLKPIKNLRKWAELDEKLWKYWLETKGPGIISSDENTNDELSEEAEVQPVVESSIVLEATDGEVEDATESVEVRSKRSTAPSPSPQLTIRELPNTTGSTTSDHIAVVPSFVAVTSVGHTNEQASETNEDNANQHIAGVIEERDEQLGWEQSGLASEMAVTNADVMTDRSGDSADDDPSEPKGPVEFGISDSTEHHESSHSSDKRVHVGEAEAHSLTREQNRDIAVEHEGQLVPIRLNDEQATASTDVKSAATTQVLTLEPSIEDHSFEKFEESIRISQSVVADEDTAEEQGMDIASESAHPPQESDSTQDIEGDRSASPKFEPTSMEPATTTNREIEDETLSTANHVPDSETTEDVDNSSFLSDALAQQDQVDLAASSGVEASQTDNGASDTTAEGERGIAEFEPAAQISSIGNEEKPEVDAPVDTVLSLQQGEPDTIASLDSEASATEEDRNVPGMEDDDTAEYEKSAHVSVPGQEIEPETNTDLVDLPSLEQGEGGPATNSNNDETETEQNDVAVTDDNSEVEDKQTGPVSTIQGDLEPDTTWSPVDNNSVPHDKSHTGNVSGVEGSSATEFNDTLVEEERDIAQQVLEPTPDTELRQADGSGTDLGKQQVLTLNGVSSQSDERSLEHDSITSTLERDEQSNLGANPEMVTTTQPEADSEAYDSQSAQIPPPHVVGNQPGEPDATSNEALLVAQEVPVEQITSSLSKHEHKTVATPITHQPEDAKGTTHVTDENESPVDDATLSATEAAIASGISTPFYDMSDNEISEPESKTIHTAQIPTTQPASQFVLAEPISFANTSESPQSSSARPTHIEHNKRDNEHDTESIGQQTKSEDN
ncbi:hypothetical protein CI109_103047 [Kwoniella shandongensis]|uniref:Inositol-pentakisphosphate 2-kinase n=1 Tax=Kwoniella shandongensis TaxID=1734106 RepID=A0AAJ8LKU4_9TREE